MGDLNKPRDIQAKFCLRLDPESAFKEGWNAAMERVKPLVEALQKERYLGGCLCSSILDYKCANCLAKEALAKFRGEN